MKKYAGLCVVFAAWCLGVPTVRGADPAPADPPGTYAGRDAAWWVGELRGAGTQRVAYEALKVIGGSAIPALATVLNHADPALRASALGLLRELPGDLLPARDAIAQALASAPDPLREQALLELAARLGRDGAPLAPWVVARLASSSAPLRGRALATLEQTGGDATVLLPPVRALLRDPEEATVAAALRVLTRLGGEAAPVVADVVAWLRAREERPTSAGTLRRGRQRMPELAAIELLAAVGKVGPEAHDALGALVRSDAAGLGQPAARALATIALVEPAAADVLVGCLTQQDVAAQRAALEVLSGLRPLPPTALEPLVRLVGSGVPDVAASAAQLLLDSRASPELYLPTLVGLLTDDRRDGRLLEILHGAADRSPEAFVRALPADLTSPTRSLLEVLRQHGGRIARSSVRALALERLVGWLSNATSDHDPRAAAVEPLVLVAGDGTDLVSRLEPLLTGGDALRSRLAAQALSRLPGTRATLVAWLSGGDGPRRRAALRALAVDPAPFSVAEDAALLALLSDPVADTRAEAAALLLAPRSGMRPVPLRPEGERALFMHVLVELLTSPVPARRSAAVLALTGAGQPCPDAMVPLIALLVDDAGGLDPEIVAGALLRTAGPDPRPLRARLLAALDPAGPETERAGAALALATLSEEPGAVEAALPALLAAGPWPARWRALIAVRRLGARGAAFEPAVRELVAYPHPTVAGEACRALSTTAPASDAARRAVAALAADRSKLWRAMAVSSLAAFGGAATQDLLALRDDPGVRAHVLGAFREMGPAAHDALPTLEADLRAHPEDAALRGVVEALRR